MVKGRVGEGAGKGDGKGAERARREEYKRIVKEQRERCFRCKKVEEVVKGRVDEGTRNGTWKGG